MTTEPPLPPTPILETGRLILRPMRLSDAPAVQRHFPHWEIVRHLLAAVPWPYPADGAETNLRDCLAKRERGERFYWAITLKGGDDALVGRIDLSLDQGDQEMRGFWLTRELWGQGLMTEAAEAVTAYAFDDLGWPELYVTNAATNLASRRIKQKQGFELVEIREGQFVEGVLPKEVWRLSADAWSRARAPRPATVSDIRR